MSNLPPSSAVSGSEAEPGFNWQTTYTNLPEGFSEAAEAAPAPEPQTVLLNEPLARELGLNPGRIKRRDGRGGLVLTGQAIPSGGDTRSLRLMPVTSSAGSPCWATGGRCCWANT